MLAITSAFWLLFQAPAQPQTAEQVVDCGARTTLMLLLTDEYAYAFDQVSPVLGADSADEAVEIFNRLLFVFPRLLGFVDGCDFSFEEAAIRIDERAGVLIDEFVLVLDSASEDSIRAAYLDVYQGFEDCLSEIGFEALLLAGLNDAPCGWG
ncbi:MAG: hypothetical protein AAGK37_01525 [Pseudomonadota bacterium]